MHLTQRRALTIALFLLSFFLLTPLGHAQNPLPADGGATAVPSLEVTPPVAVSTEPFTPVEDPPPSQLPPSTEEPFFQVPGLSANSEGISAPESAQEGSPIDGFPVVLDNQPILIIQAPAGLFSPQNRAETVTQRLATLIRDPNFTSEDLELREVDGVYGIFVNDRVLMTITEVDAKTARKDVAVLAREFLETLQGAIQTYREQRTASYIGRGLVLSFVFTLVAVACLRLIFWSFPLVIQRLVDWGAQRTSLSRITVDILIGSLRLIRSGVLIALGYTYFIFVFSFFPWTNYLAESMAKPLYLYVEQILHSLASYFPNLGVLFIIAVTANYTTRFLRFIFNQIKRGEITIPGFYRDWADPTFMLVLLGIIVLAVMTAVPYLPGFGSPAFQGVSIFLGLLATLGSTATVANVVAGLILIYSRAFQLEDRVQIGDVVGDVVEKTLLATRIRTPKNVYVTIPNATILSGSIINFSTTCKEYQATLILHTTVTLGYDIPWRKIHDTLIAAALATPHILPEPAPFVLQTSLDDFYVSYQLNAHTDQPDKISKIYSQLHQNIQDKCNENDIEILSPHYSNLRDGNQTTIPESYLPKNYSAPGFRLFPFGSPKFPP